MKRMIGLLEKAVYALCALLIALLLGMVLTQTLCRNLFRFAFVQVEELCILMLAWLTFLAAAYSLRRMGHVAVDFFFNKMPRKARYWLNIATILLLMALMAFLAWHGFGLSMRQMRTPLAITRIPRGYMFLAAPVSSVLMLLFLADSLVDCLGQNAITGVVIDTGEQIDAELQNGKKLADEVLNAPTEKEG